MDIKYITLFISFCSYEFLLFAHHGVDFVSVLSTETPHQKEIFINTNVEYKKKKENNTVKFVPAIFGGITNRLALELHSHMGKETHESFEYESTSLALQYQLSNPHKRKSWKLGVYTEYEFVRESLKNQTLTVLNTGVEAHSEEENEEHHDKSGGYRRDSDHSTGTAGNTGSTFNHHNIDDKFKFILILSKEVSESLLSLNFESFKSLGNKWQYGYAIGYRRDYSRFGVGLESSGRLDDDNHDISMALYLNALHYMTCNFSIGTGIGNQSNDFLSKMSLIFNF